MTAQELENRIEEKYGPYPDDRPGVASRERFSSEREWNEYCEKTLELMTLPKDHFLNRFPVLAILCGASTPLDK